MELEVLSYERLKARDNGELQKLIRISSNAGIFFLDLGGPSTKDFLKDMQPIVHAQRKFFAQKPELKLVYASDLEGRGQVTLSSPTLLLDHQWCSGGGT